MFVPSYWLFICVFWKMGRPLRIWLHQSLVWECFSGNVWKLIYLLKSILKYLQPYLKAIALIFIFRCWFKFRHSHVWAHPVHEDLLFKSRRNLNVLRIKIGMFCFSDFMKPYLKVIWNNCFIKIVLIYEYLVVSIFRLCFVLRDFSPRKLLLLC